MPDAAPRRGRVGRARQRRSITFLYGAISSAILIVVATVALVLAPPSPPSVAEFSPNPQKTIDDAPRAQSSRFGGGTGGDCAVGQVGCEVVAADTTTTTGPPVTTPRADAVIVKARVRRCVGDPPRQIEDPQSPPCVNYWEGDNGGATSRGVTRDEIRLAVPTTYMPPVLDSWVEFFNRRFEFYGRKIRLVRYRLPDPPTAPEQRAAAVAIDQLGAFASLQPRNVGREFFAELASRKIIGIDSHAMSFTEEEFRGWHPYVWSYPPALDTFERNQAEWICRTLAGRPARFAGPDSATNRRSFAILVQDSPQAAPPGVPNVEALIDGMSRCDARPVRVVNLTQRSPDGAGDQVAMGDLKAAGVTSIACYCDGSRFQSMQEAASQVAYTPEWLLTPYDDQDTDVGADLYPAAQRAHAFGLTSRSRLNAVASSPWYWAVREVDPSYSWQPGPSGTTKLVFEGVYQPLLLLASGIQAAGPALTPQSFAAALSRTAFPNPGAGGPPYYQSTVGFPNGSHAMVQDIAAIWFDERAESQDRAGAGAYCYVERGARWSLGRWPDHELDFLNRTQPCPR